MTMTTKMNDAVNNAPNHRTYTGVQVSLPDFPGKKGVNPAEIGTIPESDTGEIRGGDV